MTAVALRKRLQEQAAAVTAVVDEWAVRDAPVSFKDVLLAERQNSMMAMRANADTTSRSAFSK